MDPSGIKFQDTDALMVAPILSIPHVGELGTARSAGYVTLNFGDGPYQVQDIIIDLDNGDQLHGTQCWWAPILED